MEKRLKRFSLFSSFILGAVLALGVGAGIGNGKEAVPVSATQGDELAICQGTGSGYGTRRTLTDSHSVGWVLSTGQSGYLGTNNATNHGKVKPTADDLPVVKAVNSSATTNTTGYYFYYTSTAVSNVGSLEFSYTANSGLDGGTITVVSSTTAASSGSATWSVETLSGSSTSTYTSSLGTSGTFTYLFATTQTSAKYYGIVMTVSSAKRMTSGTIKLLEGAAGGHTVTTQVSGLNLSIGSIGDSGSVTLTTTTPKKKATSVSATNCTYSLSGNVLSLSSVTGNVVISATIIDADVTEISVSGQTTKFSVGDEYEFDGEVTATYDDWRPTHTSEVIDSGFTVDSSKYHKDTAGTYEITITHNGGHADSVSFNVTVLATSDYGLYSSDLVAGYYLVTASYSSSIGAMNNTISSDRAQFLTVTATDSKIKTGDSSIVWEFIKNGDYWNIKSTDSDASSAPFIASNGDANKAQMVASGDTNAAKWTITHSGSDFTIKNLGQSSRYLKRNEDYGFACYKTNESVQLYKLLELEVGITTEADKDNVLIGSTHAITLNEVRNNYKGSDHVAFTTTDTDKINLTDNGNGTASVYGKATGSATVTATLEGKTGTITLTVVRTLTGIAVSGTFEKTYTEGESFDPTGMVVTASFTGDTDKVIAAGNYSYSPSGELGTSDNEITVSYTENGIKKTDSFSITVNEVDRTIDHIVWTAPATQHYDNETLTEANVTAFAVKAYWVEDGKTNPTDIALGTYTLTLGDTEIKASDLPRTWSKADNGKTLKVSYKGEELSVTIEVIEHLHDIYITSYTDKDAELTHSDFSGTSTEMEYSNDGLSVVVSTGSSTNDYFNVFKNQTLTITADKIVSVSFECTESNPASGFADLDGFEVDGNNGSWSGNAASLTFTASNKQVRITTLTIEYKKSSETKISDTSFLVQKQLLLFVSYFNTELDKVCNDSGSSGINTTWSDLAEKYSEYRTASGNTTAFDNLIKNADATERAEDGSASTGDSLQNALARYNWIVSHHTGLTDFINTTSGRDAVQSDSGRIVIGLLNNESGSIALILIVSLSSVAVIGATMLLRKRKED